MLRDGNLGTFWRAQTRAGGSHGGVLDVKLPFPRPRGEGRIVTSSFRSWYPCRLALPSAARLPLRQVWAVGRTGSFHLCLNSSRSSTLLSPWPLIEKPSIELP